MTSEIRVDKIHNEGGDNDSGINLATNDKVKIDTAGSTKVTVDANGSVGIGVADGDVTSDGTASRTYVGIIGTGNRGRLNIGTTASNGADGGTISFVNGANELATIFNDTASGVQNKGVLHMTSTSSIKIGSGASEETVFNENGIDTDFRVEGDSNANLLFVNAGTDCVGIGTNDPQEQFHSYHPDGSNRLRVTGVGNVQCKVEIGYDATVGPYIAAGSSGQNDLHIYVDRTVIAAEFRGNGDFYSNDGTVHSLSDIRIKKDVADLTDGLDIVKQLKPKTFKYTEDSEYYNEKTKDKIKYGFVANDVEAVAPQYTDTGKGRIGGKEVDDFKTLSATKMIPMLVKAIQELEARVAELEAK